MVWFHKEKLSIKGLLWNREARVVRVDLNVTCAEKNAAKAQKAERDPPAKT
jgi:hypothetical protein